MLQTSWNSSPWFCGSCLLWYWACSLCCCSPCSCWCCCCWCCHCWCWCCWCSCTEARPARFPPHKHHNHPKHPKHPKQRNTYIRQLGSYLLWAPFLLPLPLPPFLPLLPGAIKSVSLHFLRAARTLNFNLMREARGQCPPSTGFSPGRPESTF